MQPTKKFSQLPPDAAPTTDDYFAVTDATSTQSKKVLLSDLLTLFFTQTAIPAGGGSPVTRHNETLYDFVASGGVWAGDSYAVNRNASMSAMICYINGYRISIAAVSARAFTASKDTYVDVLSNQDGTGTLVYTEVANNAASPALAANSIRIGIIVTGATTIAAVGSVNQGQPDKVLPIASSVPYQTTDSLGNLICSRDSERRTLGYRQMITLRTYTALAQVLELSCPVIVPTNNQRIIAKVQVARAYNGTGISEHKAIIFDGAVGGTQVGMAQVTSAAASHPMTMKGDAELTPAAGSKTYNVGASSSANTLTLDGAATYAAFVKIERG